MTLLWQPVLITTHTGEVRRGTVLQLDWDTELAFCSIPMGYPGARCTGWFSVSQVELLDGPEELGDIS